MFFSSKDVFEKKKTSLVGKTKTTSSGKDNVTIRDDDNDGTRLVHKKVVFFSSPFVVVLLESLLAKTKAETKREKSIEREREREKKKSPVGVRYLCSLSRESSRVALVVRHINVAHFFSNSINLRAPAS